MGNTIGLPACPKGNSITFKLVVNQNGTPIDITGYSFAFIANKDLSGKVQPPVQLGWVQTISSPNGQTTFKIPGALTGTLEPGAYYFNLDMSDLLGNITTIMAGTWPVTAVPGTMNGSSPSVPPPGGGGGGGGGTTPANVMLQSEYAIGGGQTNPNLVDHAQWADSAPITGNMLKAVYDTNNDGIVDLAASVPWSGVTNTAGVVELLTNKGMPGGYALLDTTGKVTLAELPPVVLEAPTDGTIYGRKNASWIMALGEAPTDGQFYGRQSSTWIALPPQGVLNWSANEQWTGRTWLDGSKVYQKTINLGNLPTSNNSVTVNHNITFLALVIHHDGWAHDAANIVWFPIPNAPPNGSLPLEVQATTITVDAQSMPVGSYTGYVTLYYTCTNR